MVGSLTCDYIQYGSYGCSGYINLIIFVIVTTIAIRAILYIVTSQRTYHKL